MKHNWILLFETMYLPLIVFTIFLTMYLSVSCVSVSSVNWVNLLKMGGGVNSSKKPLKCMLKYFKEDFLDEAGCCVFLSPRK